MTASSRRFSLSRRRLLTAAASLGAGVIAGVTALAVAGVLIARAVSGSGKGAGEKRRSA